MKPKAKTIQERFGFADPELTTPSHDAIMLWLKANLPDILEVKLKELKPRADVAKLQERAESFKRKVIEYHQRKVDQGREYLLEKKAEGEDSTDAFGHGLRVKRQANIEKEFEECIASTRLGVPLDVPAMKSLVIGKQIFEYPIDNHKGFLMGFADLYVEAVDYDYGLAGVRDDCYHARDLEIVVSPTGYELMFEVKTKIPSLGEVLRQVRMYESASRRTYQVKFFIVSPDSRFRSVIEEQGIGFVECPLL